MYLIKKQSVCVCVCVCQSGLASQFDQSLDICLPGISWPVWPTGCLTALSMSVTALTHSTHQNRESSCTHDTLTATKVQEMMNVCDCVSNVSISVTHATSCWATCLCLPIPSSLSSPRRSVWPRWGPRTRTSRSLPQ